MSSWPGRYVGKAETPSALNAGCGAANNGRRAPRTGSATRDRDGAVTCRLDDGVDALGRSARQHEDRARGLAHHLRARASGHDAAKGAEAAGADDEQVDVAALGDQLLGGMALAYAALDLHARGGDDGRPLEDVRRPVGLHP